MKMTNNAQQQRTEAKKLQLPPKAAAIKWPGTAATAVSIHETAGKMESVSLAAPFEALRSAMTDAMNAIAPAMTAITTLDAAMEDLEDAAAGYAALAEDETYPGELIDSIAAGENPVRAFRKYRGMSQAALAEQAGVRQGTVSGIERGHLARVDTVAAIARALGTDIEMLLPLAD